ncbi:MAG: hypothetical protein V2B15_06535 [Bacteroidota bacterium]
MEPSTLLTIGMWTLGILLSVVGFFLVYFFKRSVESDDKLNETVGKLQISVTALNGTLLSQDDKISTFTGSCKDKHIQIDKRLEVHGIKIDDHEKRITVIEAKS